MYTLYVIVLRREKKKNNYLLKKSIFFHNSEGNLDVAQRKPKLLAELSGVF